MKILLALDTSPASETALRQLLVRLWPPGSSFEVVSVVEPSPLWSTSETAAESADLAREVVRKAVARIRDNGWDALGTTLFGDPRLQLLDRAKGSAADLICLGSHGHSALGRFLLGTVASAVLRHAACSVEVIRRDSEVRKILLATDGSAFSEAAARSVAGGAWPAGTEVRVISALQLLLPAAHALFDLPFVESQVVEDARGDAMKRALEATARAVNILSGTGLAVTDSVSVLFESPRDIILQEAASWGADLIVLGSHGRHGADRFLLGSVSEAVAMHAACSVEVVRLANC